MVVDSAHQIRVVVLPKSAARNAELSKIVRRKLGAGWHVQRLTRGSRLVLITGSSEHTVGTPEHARESHEAALALFRSKHFSRVEADVPVPVDVEPGVDSTGAFGDDPCVNNPPPLDWVHQILRWPEAIAEMSDCHARRHRHQHRPARLRLHAASQSRRCRLGPQPGSRRHRR